MLVRFQLPSPTYIMPNFLITGSVAARHWFHDFREPNDVDILTATPIILTSSHPSAFGIEAHHGDIFTKIIEMNISNTFVDPDILYTIKMSHAQWDIKWDKTIKDMIFFQRAGCTLNEPLYDELVEHWTTVHGPKRVNLKMGNDEFFSDAVKRIIPHDRLHELVAFYEKPMHTLIRPDLTSPKPDKALWDALSWRQKMETAMEELCVVAIERGRLTEDSKRHDIHIAYRKAYKSLVTTMTKGWFCDFLLANAAELLVDVERNVAYYNIKRVVESETFIMEMKNGIGQR